MPCRDWDDSGASTVRYYQQRNDELSSMLCEACAQIERAKIHFPSARLSRWWENHKEQDRKAKEAAIKRLELDKKKQKAMNKLTKEELRLLGILDRK